MKYIFEEFNSCKFRPESGEFQFPVPVKPEPVIEPPFGRTLPTNIPNRVKQISSYFTTDHFDLTNP